MISNSLDTITRTQFITDDGNTIVSSGESFELGFFSPGSSGNRYLGIWYKKISTPTVVWIANRKIPLTDTSGVLKFTNQGILTLVNRTNSIIWSSNTSRSTQDPIAQLLDSGNLVVRDANDVNLDNFLWQSFDYPSDTMLPGMKLGKNLATGLNWYISSWKSNDDPSPGDFTYRCNPQGYPQFFLTNGSLVLFRSGPWNGLHFSGAPSLKQNSISNLGFFFNKQEVYMSYELPNRLENRKRGMSTSMEGFNTLVFFFFFFSVLMISNSVDTITATRFITDDGNTIVSSGESFELGFFSPGSSGNRYLGIWYKKISTGTVVWVANRKIPLTDKSGVLKVTNQGILTLLNRTNSIIWSSNTSRSTQDPVAQLLDSGNLVVRDANDDNPKNFLWQSFDYPSDTILPGMKLGKNLATGLDRYMSSWKSIDDPSPGNFTYRCNSRGYPQFFLRNGSSVLFRTGPWNGLHYSGTPNLKPNTIFKFGFVFNKQEVYYSYELLNSSVVSRFMLSQDGHLQRWTWVERTQNWVIYLSVPVDNCDIYGTCGAYGSCNINNSPVCGCLSKFVPKYPEDWDTTDWSSGCVRKTPLDCQNGDGFLKYSDVKLPDTQYSWFNESMNLRECEMVCLRNCSCMAYANLDVRGGGSGCLLWFGELIDIREFPGVGQDIYIRMASSELGSPVTITRAGSKGKKAEIIIVSLAISIGTLLLALGLILYIRRKKKKNAQMMKREERMGHTAEQGYTNESRNEDMDLPLFNLITIANATNNFSINNKLGEGGFGPVYKEDTEMEGKSALLTCSLFSILIVSTAVDTITTTQSIKDGETIVSAGGSFKLGFFSPGNSNNRYVGIWYNQIPIFTVVWVANREVPLDDSSGILNVTRAGILVLLNRTDSIIWSSNSSRTAKNPVAQLLDSGNLVVKDASDDDDNPKNFLWQSFDYPSDTFLPGMEFGRVTATGLDRYLWSWKSMDDPARGDFTYRIDPRGYPQYFLRRDSVEQFRSGPWNGLRFSGMPDLYSNPIYNFTFVLNQREMYFTYELLNSSVVSRMMLNPNGVVQRLTWMDGVTSWTAYLTVQMYNCDMYARCGAYSICTIDKTPECECLEGFVPSSPIDWGMADWASGCVRRTPLDCQNGDGFLKYSGVKLPDTRISWFNESITLKECELQCLKDCSCMAYSSLDISGGGSGCFLWFGPLIDIREFTENGQDLYVRMAASELGQAGSIWEKGKWIIIGSVVSTGTIMLGLGVTLYVWKKKRQQKREGRMVHQDLHLPLFDFTTIVNATNNFSINNKLGEGGFGPVYKSSPPSPAKQSTFQNIKTRSV
ncbi:hypothetical protein F0562_010215 [Nyssa sinensis]|uniref:Uncharacterized protein n=1 Tax=Nyssa sinensis TaxID=561372 RepID=A0A5J5A1Y5_9ASTE|nr:hypothetical protein F0562_010215 [Nyssa sinensis]